MKKDSKNSSEHTTEPQGFDLEIKPYVPFVKDDDLGRAIHTAQTSDSMPLQIGALTMAILSLRDAVREGNHNQTMMSTLFNNNVTQGLQAMAEALGNMSNEATIGRVLAQGGDLDHETGTLTLPKKPDDKDNKPRPQHGHYL